MTISDWITIGGTIVTISATILTILQAISARQANANAKAAATSVRLSANAERLRSAQAQVRLLPSRSTSRRGSKPEAKIVRIREEFDSVLGSLPKTGPTSSVRTLVLDAQEYLNQYEASQGADSEPAVLQELQRRLQDAISDLTNEASNMEPHYDHGRSRKRR